MGLVQRLLAVAACSLAIGGCQGGHPRAGESYAVEPSPAPPPWTTLNVTARADLPAGLPGDASIQSIAFGPDGYIAVGRIGFDEGALVLRSSDGGSWVQVKDADLNGLTLQDLAANSERLVATGTLSGGDGPVGQILGSADGDNWEVGLVLPNAVVNHVAAGPAGTFLATASRDDGGVLLASDDGVGWEERSAEDSGLPAGLVIGDVASADAGWLLVGSLGPRGGAWTSLDGAVWSEVPMSGAEPIGGVASVEVDSVVATGDRALALGRDNPPCDGDADECPHLGAAWVLSTSGWDRLPASSPVAAAWGIQAWPIGDAFLMADGGEFRVSADGWSWTVVSADEDMEFVSAILEQAGKILIAGERVAQDGSSRPWMAIASPSQ